MPRRLPVALKSNVSRELRLKNQPKLVEIIAAIPEEYKPILLPKLKAKPVRTASGVRVRTQALRDSVAWVLTAHGRTGGVDETGLDCRRRRHVQAAPVSAHRDDGQHLCVRFLPILLGQRRRW